MLTSFLIDCLVCCTKTSNLTCIELSRVLLNRVYDYEYRNGTDIVNAMVYYA